MREQMIEKMARAIAWSRAKRQFGDAVDVNKIEGVIINLIDRQDAEAAFDAQGLIALHSPLELSGKSPKKGAAFLLKIAKDGEIF